MGVIEDTRKVMQDFLAPELRAISVRLDALEKRYESLDKKVDEVDRHAEKRIDALKVTLEQRFDSLKIDLEQRLGDAERRAEQRHELTMMAIARLTDYAELRERRVRLESKQMAAA